MDNTMEPWKEATVGGALFTTPAWVIFLNETSLIASTIAAICGAIVGIHAVYRLIKRRRENKNG